MELLAPAGNIENFHAALEAGADAVYVGAPGLNARNLSKDFTLEQIASLIATAHGNGKKIYVAINSLARENDLKQLLETLAFFEIASPDALIIQDLGILNLVMNHFPSLELHGSTLMTVHNRAGADTLSSLGFAQVVIAREYTVKEIARLIRESRVDVEVFIHGAMCFSYSGLCMFSSYLGGKSGLRGKCVQPCRRKYSIGSSQRGGKKTKKGSGYLFSMNDLNGLEMVPELLKIGVSSLKIEGRLRSATYVKNIVSAYRMMIDSGDEYNPSVHKKASELVTEAMGRKTSSGYFRSPQPVDAIVSIHSGNIGTHLGRVVSVEQTEKGRFLSFKPKRSFKVGDRIRLHFETSGKRESFTVNEMTGLGEDPSRAEKNIRISVSVPDRLDNNVLRGKIDVFLVDVEQQKPTGERPYKLLPGSLSNEKRKIIAQKVQHVSKFVLAPHSAIIKTVPQNKKRYQGSSGSKCELWLRVDTCRQILGQQPVIPDRYVINLDKQNISSAGEIKRFLGRNMRSVIWALPPVLNDSAYGKIKRSISGLIKSGFKTFQIGHLSQIELFEGERVQLFGDYSLNLMNSQALDLVSKLDFRGVQLSIEMNRELIKQAITGYRDKRYTKHGGGGQQKIQQLGLTVYGAPPLFVSRITSNQLPYGKSIISPKNEQFFVEKKDGHTITRPKKPFSLLPFRRELEMMGLNFLVIDLSGTHPGKKGMVEIKERINNKGKYVKLPTFNYLGTLE